MIHCGEVHCGENLCVLVGVVGKIHTYVKMIHCGESALWGKSVRPIVGVVGKIHTYVQMIHCGKVRCGENLCILVGVVGKNFVSPQCKLYFPTVQCFDVRHSL